MDSAGVISIISVFISVISTIVAAFAILSNHQIKDKEVTVQNYEDVKDWFERTLNIMKELYIKYPTNKNKEKIKEVLIRFGTSIDVGRLYFRNRLYGEYKMYKPEIFRGRRALILDILVFYYDIFYHGLQEENQEILWGLQRAFISETVQYLEKNLASHKAIEYTYFDCNHILHISNLNNKKFREMLLSKDIVKQIKESNKQTLQSDENEKSKRK